jgi:hypothetical protein
MTYLATLSNLLKVVEVALVVSGLCLAAQPESFKGTISAVSEKQVIVATTGEQRPFEVDTETKITLDGQAAKLTSLPVGSPVEVTAAKSDTGMKALTISAMSLKGAGSQTPAATNMR